MWFFSLIALLILIALSVLYIMIINNLVDFQTDRINPLDICSSLDKLIKPVKIIHLACAAATLTSIKYCFPVTLFNLGIAYYFYSQTKTHRYFEPLTIVRDSDGKKYRLIGCLVGVVLSFIYMLVYTIIDLII